MFVSHLTSTSGFGELNFLKELLTAVGVTKEADHFFCMTGQIEKLSTKLDVVQVHQNIFRISPLGVHVSLQSTSSIWQSSGLSSTAK